MLNLFKSKAKEVEAPKEAVSDQLVADLENAKMEIESLKKALSMYDETLSNHWATIARLQGMDSRLESPNTKKIKRLEDDNFVINQVIAKLLEADYEKKMDKKFNDFLKKYKDGIENHAMHINALLDGMDKLREEVKQLRIIEAPSTSLRGSIQRHDGHIGYLIKRVKELEVAIVAVATTKPIEAQETPIKSVRADLSLMTPEQKREHERMLQREYNKKYYAKKRAREQARKNSQNYYQKNKEAILAKKRAKLQTAKEKGAANEVS